MSTILRNISYSLVSNALSFFVSATVTFVVPKAMGVSNYGYFQLFHFYTTYTGLLQFGWADGLILRYGGAYYNKLNKKRFSAQFWGFTLLESLLGIVVMLGAMMYIQDTDKANVVCLAGTAIIILMPRIFLQYVLQVTNRVKDYALLVVIEKLVYVLLILTFILAGVSDYVLVICCSLMGSIIALIYSIYQCREIVFSIPAGISDFIGEAKDNIVAGIKLTFSNVASMLIIGIVRMSIENQWDVATFGKVSLTMSVSNLLMVFIRAVALVMFPMLRRTNSDKLAGIYNTMRTCLMIPLLGMLVFYYPMKEILSAWLPAYADSLKYMALLFPMCVFESKTSMLIETYMKTLRKEKTLLFVNVATVCLSVLLTGITVYGMHNLDLAIVSIVVLLAFRCVIAELLLSGSMEIQVRKDIVLELALTVIFICASWFIGGLSGLAIYAVAYLIYLFIKRHDVVALMGFVKRKVLARG